MPRYEVIEKGFWGGVLRTPGDERHGYVVTDEPIPKDKFPSWLKPAKVETPAAAKAASDKVAKVKAGVDAAKKDITGASFLAKPSVVETL